MVTPRSPETLKKEHELQAEYTTRMNLILQESGEGDYRLALEDAAMFANTLRKYVPEPTLVILHDRPEIILTAEGEGYKVSLFINGKCWRFKVNDSVNYTLDDGEKVGPTRMLKKIWDVVIENLPENFIVKGVVDPRDPKEEFDARTALQKGLGFGPPQPTNEVYGVVRNKKLNPLTLEEFSALTKLSPNELDQKFNVRKIDWPGV